MDSLATQKKINTSKLTARIFSTTNNQSIQDSCFSATVSTGQKAATSDNKGKPMVGAGFSMSFRIAKTELSNMTADVSSKPE
jgi:hypothetical protein